MKAPGTLPGSSEVRNAKPATLHGRPGSVVESMGMTLPLDSACPVTLPPGLVKWRDRPRRGLGQGTSRDFQQPLTCQAYRFLSFFSFKLLVLKKLAFLLVASLRFFGD